MPQKTAAILAIGDELLSGRPRDANIHILAGWLATTAIGLPAWRLPARCRRSSQR